MVSQLKERCLGIGFILESGSILGELRNLSSEFRASAQRMVGGGEIDEVLVGTIERMNYGLPSAPVRTEEVVISVNHVTDQSDEPQFNL